MGRALSALHVYPIRSGQPWHPERTLYELDRLYLHICGVCICMWGEGRAELEGEKVTGECSYKNFENEKNISSLVYDPLSQFHFLVPLYLSSHLKESLLRFNYFGDPSQSHSFKHISVLAIPFSFLSFFFFFFSFFFFSMQCLQPNLSLGPRAGDTGPMSSRTCCGSHLGQLPSWEDRNWIWLDCRDSNMEGAVDRAISVLASSRAVHGMAQV